MDYEREYIDKNPSLHIHHGERKAQEILGILPKKKFNRIIDIACGPGRATKTLNKYLKPKQFVATDISPHMIKAAKAADTEGEIEWKLVDVFDFNPTSRFDLAIATDVIEHIEDDLVFLKKLGELADAAALIIPHERAFFWKLLRDLKLIDLWKHNEKQYGHIHFYDTQMIKELTEKSDWHIKELKYETWPIFKLLFFPLLLNRRYITKLFGGRVVVFLEKL